MAKKQIPPDLTAAFLARYATPDRRARRRKEAEAYAQKAFGLDESALTAIVVSPFASQGLNLRRWLSSCHPDLLHSEVAIRALLSGTHEDGEQLAARLTRLTTLSLPQMRVLWARELVGPAVRAPGRGDFIRQSGQDHLIVHLLRGDPHQCVVRTRLSPDGPEVEELISGR
jgi:hypothetical protein